MSTLKALDLQDIRRVEFYKRDELTADLICCDLVLSDAILRCHEEMPDWHQLLDCLQTLDGFRSDWFTIVSQPPFMECRFTAYEKPTA